MSKLRASDGALLGTFAVGSNPHGVAFDGANIWVANFSSNNVSKLRASDGTLLGTFAVGSFPNGVAFDGANIWVTNISSNTVSKLRASDGAVLGTENSIEFSQVPEPVRAAAEKYFGTASGLKAMKGEEYGETHYEIEGTKNGKTVEVTFDPMGKRAK